MLKTVNENLDGRKSLFMPFKQTLHLYNFSEKIYLFLKQSIL